MRERHGHTTGGRKSPEFNVWNSMKARCLNPNSRGYSRYGGRGIRVCDRWLHSFTTFLADMGARPEGTSIDRVDVDGNYEPGNCRWASSADQAANKRHVKVRSDGKLWSEVAGENGVSSSGFSWRLRHGWDVEVAATTPPTPQDSRHRRPARGEQNHNSKMTTEKVKMLRALRETGLSYSKLGKQFSICAKVARLICTGKAWKHV